MNLIIAFISLVSGYFYGAYSNKSKYVYGFDITHEKGVLHFHRRVQRDLIISDRGGIDGNNS